MPSPYELFVAQHAASGCISVSRHLLNVARLDCPESLRAGLIAKYLDELAQWLPGAVEAISTVEPDLNPAAPDPIEAGGMACSTAHRRALDFATDLAESVREIDPRLVPGEQSVPPWPPDFAALVKEHLPAIVAKLAARPPFDARHIASLIGREWWYATARLNAAGPPAGPSPPVGSAGRTDRTEAAAEQPGRPPEGEPPADPARTTQEDGQPDGAGASGSKAPGSRAARQARKVPRGELDERAVAMLLKNPNLTCVQLAAALGCSAGTLRDRKKCPRLAKARASIRAQREAFQGGSTWRDRRPDDDEA